MRTSWLVCLLVGLLVSCSRPEMSTVLPRPNEPHGPMIDYEPEGEVPSFHRLHKRVFEPHWL